MALINPQFPYAGPVPIPGPAPTETMPLLNYRVEGRIAGIQQARQFMPFLQGPHRAVAEQTYYAIGTGIQMGQSFNQPLINTQES
ncbi:cementing protein [Enterobacteria phage PRDmint]